MSSVKSIDWSDLSILVLSSKKEARGINDYDLGEIQEIGTDYVVTQKGTIKRQKFYIPKYLAEGYDGEVLRFRVSDKEAENDFARDLPPSAQEYSKYRALQITTDTETSIPVIAERLDVSKTESNTEATVIKEPITETKTIEVPVTHEELFVERRPVTNVNDIDQKTIAKSKTEINIPLKAEMIRVRKESFVKEELVVKKKPVTETRTFTEKIRTEKVKVEGPDGRNLEE